MYFFFSTTPTIRVSSYKFFEEKQVNRAFVFRLYPTEKQEEVLNDQVEVCRQFYNDLISCNNISYQKHGHSLVFEFQSLIKHMRAEEGAEDLKSVYCHVLQDVCNRVTAAYISFFKRWKLFKQGLLEKKPGLPRRRGVGRYDSLKFSNCGARLVGENRLRLSKVGNIKMRKHQDIPEGSKLLSVTVRRRASGKWYASLSYDVPDTYFKKLPKTAKKIGIDLGITNFVVTSEKDEEKSAKCGYPCGMTIKKPNHLRSNLVMLRKLQKQFDKAKKGSKKRRKLGLQLARLHEKIANERRDFHHKLSRRLVNEYDAISVENLNVKEMIRHYKEKEKEMNPKEKAQERGRRRNIGDCGWSNFTRMIAYKAEEAGRRFVLVDPRNTTKMCNRCKELVPKTMKERTHVCPRCGLVLDRDFNAALNIEEKGLGTRPEVKPQNLSSLMMGVHKL